MLTTADFQWWWLITRYVNLFLCFTLFNLAAISIDRRLCNSGIKKNIFNIFFYLCILFFLSFGVVTCIYVCVIRGFPLFIWQQLSWYAIVDYCINITSIILWTKLYKMFWFVNNNFIHLEVIAVWFKHFMYVHVIFYT